jgi:LacI family transcriptional regulator
VGVVVADIGDPVIPPIIRGLESGLEPHGYAAILANTDGSQQRESDIIDIMRARGVDGLALVSVRYHDEAVSRIAAELPIVTVARHTDNPKLSRAIHDESEGFRRLLNHLVSYGHRQIAQIAGPQDISTGRNRHHAFRTHAKALKISADPQLTAFARFFNEQEGERCAEELLARAVNFSALVCANDRLAIGAIAALRRHGRNCPDDISVTGFNDMPFLEHYLPRLTTVRIQQHQLGLEAARILTELMEATPGRRQPREAVLPVEIVIRDSTKRHIG